MSTNNLTQTLLEDAALLFASSNNNQLLVADGGSAILTYTFKVANGVLVLGSTSGVTFTGNNSGTITVTGTSAAINAAINGLVYSPTANYFGTDTLTVLNGAATVMTFSLAIAAVNDAPVITLQSASQTFNEDTAKVFSSANGNAITVADVDTFSALKFDGTSTSFLALPDTKLSGDITLEAWVNVTDVYRQCQRIFDFGNGSGIKNIYLTLESGKLTFSNFDSSNIERVIRTSSALSNGLHHLAVSVSDAGLATLYVDGASVASGNVGIVPSAVRANNYIGKSNWAEDPFFLGQIRDVRIWDVERTQAQIQAEMQALSNPDATGLKAWYPMTETSGSTVTNAAVVTVADGLSAADVALVNTALTRPATVTQVTALTTTVTVSEGTLTLGSLVSGAAITAGANNSATMTLSGTAAQINAALAGLTYNPLLNANGAKTLTVTTSDGALSSTQTVALNITAVNDAPVIQLAGAQTFRGTSSTVFSPTPASTALNNTFSVELTVTPGRTILLPGQSQNTISWMNDYLLFPEQGGSNTGFGMTVGTNGVVVSEHGDSQLAPLLVWTGAVSAGTKLAVVVTNKTPQLYVNGTLVATGLTSLRSTLFVRPGSGIGGGAYGYYSGTASDLRYWDKALSAAEVATNYQTQPPLSTASLNAVYLSSTGNKSTIAENLANGTAVGQAFASDVDSATLTYSLVGAGSDVFAINVSSGVITVKDATKLDYENSGVNHQVALDVTVSDGSTAVVKTQQFTLTNVNDAPVTTLQSASQTFNEDTAKVFSSANGNAITVADVDTFSALKFDGTSTSFLALPDTKLSGDITLEAWVNFTDVNRYWQRIFDFGNGAGANNIVLAVTGTTGRLAFHNFDSSNTQRNITAPSAVSNGMHHVAVSVTSTGMASLYVDGALVVSGNVGIVPGVARTNNYIGKSNWGSGDAMFLGQIRDVRIWDVERTQAQIQAEMQALSNPDATGLKAWYPMTETSGSTVTNAAVVTVADGLSAADVALVNTALARPATVTQMADTGLPTWLTTTVTASEGTLTLGSTSSGASITAGANNSSTVTLFGTAAQINTALAGLTYNPLLNANGAKTFTVTTSDGALSSTQTVALNITPVNDAPVIAVQSTSQSFSADTIKVFNAANSNAITVADVDNTTLTTIVAASQGTLALGSLVSGAVITAGANNSASVTLRGTAAQINIALTSLAYTPTANYIGTANLTITTNDGRLSSTQSVALNIAALTATAISTMTASQLMNSVVLENLSAVQVAAIAPAELSQLGGDIARLKPSALAGSSNLVVNGDFSASNVGTGWGVFSNGSVLGWTNTLNGEGIEIDYSAILGGAYTGTTKNAEINVNTPGAISQTISGLTVGAQYNLTWAYGDRPGAGQQQLNVYLGNTLVASSLGTGTQGAMVWTKNSVTVTATSATDVLIFRAINIGGSQGMGNDVTAVSLTASAGLTASQISALTLGQINALTPAQLSALTPLQVRVQSLNEDTANTFSAANGNAIITNLSGAAVTTTVTAANGKLVLGSTGSGSIIAAGANNSASVTLSGTAAQINTALNGLSYTPDANFYGTAGLKVISSNGQSSGTQIIVLSIAAVNDAPVTTLQSASQNFNEDTARVFSSANGNAITVADVDSTTLTTSVTASEGTIALGSLNSGASITAGANNSATVSLSGTATQIKSALEGLTYTPLVNANGAKTLTVTTSDGTLSSTQTVALNVTAVNDAAIISGTRSASLIETNAVLTTGGTLSITDIDSAATFMAQTSVAGSNGYGTFNLTSAGVWSYIANTAHNEFIAGTTYTETLSIASADGTASTLTVNILGTNDAAIISGTSSLSLTETDAALTASGTLAITDVDSAATFLALNGVAGSNGYGTFNLTSAGAWSYATNTAHNEFVAGVTYTDSFTVVSADFTASTVTVSILGTNEAPVVTLQSASQTFSEDTAKVFSSANGNAITVADADTVGTLRFDGTSTSFLALPDIKLSGDITIEAWVNATDATRNWQRIFDFGNGAASNNILLAFDGTSGRLAFHNFDSTNTQRSVTASAALSSGWHQVAVSISSTGTGTLYVDGAAVVSGYVGTVASVARSNNYVGKSNWGSGDAMFAGQIRDVRIWDIERTQAQIQGEMLALSNPDATGLKAWYPMSETTGSTVANAAVATGADGLVAADVALVITAVARPTTVTQVADTRLPAWLMTSVTASEGILTLGSTSSGASITAGANNSATMTLAGTSTQINAALAGLSYTPLLGATGSKTLTVTTSDAALSSTNSINLSITASPSLAAWSAAQVTALSTSAVGTLTASQIGTLTSAAIGGLTAAQIPWLSSTGLARLTATQVAALSASAVAALNVAQIGAMSSTALIGLTPAQTAALSVAAVAGLKAVTLAGFTVAALPTIAEGKDIYGYVYFRTGSLDYFQAYAGDYLQYKSDWNAYNAAQLPRLSAAQVAALSPSAIGGLTIAQLYRFSATQLQALTATQIIELPKSQTSLLTATQISLLTVSARVGLADVDATGYSATQMQALSNTQVSRITTASLALLAPAVLASLSMTQLQSLGIAQIAVLSNAQFTALSTVQLGSLSAAQVSALQINVVQALTAAQVNAISGTALIGLTPAQTAALSVAAVAGLKAVTLAGFTVAALPTIAEGKDIYGYVYFRTGSLDYFQAYAGDYLQYKSDWNAYNAAQLPRLSAAQVAALSPSAIGGLTIAQLYRFSATQLQALTGNQLAELPGTQTSQLTATQISFLTASARTGLADVDATGYSATQIQALSITRVSRITTASLASLEPAVLASLSAAQIQYLSTAQIAVLSSAQVTALSTAQLGTLSAAQVSALRVSAVQELSGTQIGAMSAVALIGLTTIQIKALSTDAVAGLTAVTLAGFTVAALPTIAEGKDIYGYVYFRTGSLDYFQTYASDYLQYKSDWNAYNAAQLPLMSTAQVAALSTTAVGSLTVAQLLRFSNEQLQALTAAQRAALAWQRLPNGDVVTIDGLTMPRVNTSVSSIAVISSWTSNQLKLLSTAQWNAMTPVQVGSLNPASLAGLTTTEIFAKISEAQLKTLCTAHYMAWSTTTRNALTSAQLSSLGGNFLKGMTTTNLMGMTSAQRQGLSASQVQSLPHYTVFGLTSANLNQVIADGFFAKFSGFQARQLDPLALAGVSNASFTAIVNANFQGLLLTHIAVLPSSVWTQATGAALSAMQILSFQAITAAQLGQISASAIGDLTAQRWSEFSPTQVGYLSTAQLAAKGGLKGLRVEGLTASQISGLGADKIAALDIADLAKLSTIAMGSLTIAQVQALSPAKIRAFGAAQIQAMSASALQSVSDTQKNAMRQLQRDALSARGINVSQANDNASKGLTLAKLMYASNAILNNAGNAPGNNSNGYWSQLIETATNPDDGTRVALFKYIDGAGKVEWTSVDDYWEATVFAVSAVLINGVASDVNWASSYVPVWNNPATTNNYGRYRSGNTIDWVDDDIASLFSASDVYGRNHLLANLRSYSLENINDYAGGLGAYITSENMYYLSAATLNGLSDDMFRAVLNLSPYWSQFSQTGGNHASGAVASDNPFGTGLLDGLNSAKFGIYMAKVVELYNARGGTGGLFSDGLWADISDQKKSDTGVLNTYLNQLTPRQLQSLSTDLINKITGDVLKSLADSRLDLLKSFTPAQISVLPTAAINALAEKVVNFTADQFLAFTGIQISGIESPDAWRNVVANYSDIAQSYIDRNPLYLSGGTISTLTPAEIARLPSVVVQNLSQSNLVALSTAQVASLTAAQVAMMSPAQLGWLGTKVNSLSQEAILVLTSQQLAGLSATQLSALPVKPIVNMTSAEITAVTVSNLINFSGKALTMLSDAQLAGLTRIQALNLLPSQYLALTDAQRLNLKATPVAFMTKAQIKALTAADILLSDKAQVSLLTAAQLRAMSTVQIQALSQPQFSSIQPWVMGSLQSSDFAKFSNIQASYLTADQLISVDSTYAAGLSSKWAGYLSALAKNELINISTPKARLPKELRYAYTISNLARSERSFLDTFSSQLRLRYAVDFPLDTALFPKERAIFLAQQQFAQNQKQSVYQRHLLQKGRAFGSTLALGSVVSAFGMANQAARDGDKEKTVMYSLAGIAYFASLLQVPVNELISYDCTRVKLQRELNAATAKLNIYIDYYFNLMEVGPKSEFDQLTANKQVAQTNMDNHKALANAKWGIPNLMTPVANAGVIKASVTIPTVTGFDDLLVKTRWNDHDTYFTQWETKRIASSIFMAADFTGLAYSSYQLGTAIKNNDAAGIGFGVVDTFGSTLVLIGDGVDFVKKPSAKVSMFASRALGSGLMLAQLASSGASIYSNAKYYVDHPGNDHARDALIADVFIQATLLAITVALMYAGPIGMVVGMIVLLGVPNAAAIRQVKELQAQQKVFNDQGRTVWGNTVFAPLIKIAEMNINSLTAMASFDYATTEMDKLAIRMRAGKMQELLGQDYKHYLSTEVTTTTDATTGVTKTTQQKTLNTISSDINDSLTSTTVGVIKIASFINIDRQAADEKDYYASKTNNVLTYASRLDVRKKKADETLDFDVVAAGLNDSAINMTITDVDTTKTDSLIVVNLSSADALTDKKAMNITNNTKNNKVNFYVTATNVQITGSASQGSTITVVEGQASGVKVNSLSGFDVVNYSGASLNADGTIANATGVTFWNQIHLNNFINVAAVIAGATTMHNTVTGSVAKQSYSFNNGRDKVTMTGGQGVAIVGGQETELLMAGGNNYASVKLGGRVDGMAWASDAKQGVYDGGLCVSASGTIGMTDYLQGVNTISFAEAYAQLQIDIVEPLSSLPDATYTTYSKVTTLGLDVQDTGVFRNFQTVIGSNLGDTININGTSTLRSLVLGMGQNSVSITDVKASTATSAADKSALTITALLSLDAAHSDITLNNSDVGFEGSLNSNNLIQVVNASSFAGALRGNDRIFTDNNANNLVKVAYAEGEHVLNLHGGNAEVIMFSDYSGDAVITVDENENVATALVLSGNQLNQMVMRDVDGLHFSLAQTNGDAQEVDYSFGDMTSDLARNTLTVVKLFKDSGTQVAVTVAALNDAINALSGSTNYSTTTSSFTFDTLYQKALILHPNV